MEKEKGDVDRRSEYLYIHEFLQFALNKNEEGTGNRKCFCMKILKS